MSQTIVDFSGDSSGDELLDDLLGPMQENILTRNSGTSRPAYAKQGTEWIDRTSVPWIVKCFNGTVDIITGYINTVTNVYTPAGLLLDKTDATTSPTINDDSADGYSVGSFWIDVTNDRAYTCVDSTVGAAIWKDIDGNVNGQSSSINSEIALFNGNTGRSIKRATGTGYVKVVNGVMGTPLSSVPISDLGTQAANSVLINNTPTSATPIPLVMAASTILARLATGNIIAATMAEITAMLNDLMGDAGTGGTKGLVPAPAAGDAAANKFLKANATWSAIPNIQWGTPAVMNPVSNSAVISQAHGLSSPPNITSGYWECTTADAGYSVGDRVLFGGMSNRPAGDGFYVSTDAVDITIIPYSGANNVDIAHKSTRGATTITFSSWKLVLYPGLF